MHGLTVEKHAGTVSHFQRLPHRDRAVQVIQQSHWFHRHLLRLSPLFRQHPHQALPRISMTAATTTDLAPFLFLKLIKVNHADGYGAAPKWSSFIAVHRIPLEHTTFARRLAANAPTPVKTIIQFPSRRQVNREKPCIHLLCGTTWLTLCASKELLHTYHVGKHAIAAYQR
jgi:hypothetical protein